MADYCLNDLGVLGLRAQVEKYIDFSQLQRDKEEQASMGTEDFPDRKSVV